jgi:hypothetical protein
MATHTFEQILAPVHQQVTESHMTDDELDRLFKATRKQVRKEKRSARSR